MPDILERLEFLRRRVRPRGDPFAREIDANLDLAMKEIRRLREEVAGQMSDNQGGG
jgi:hypothetical protein